MARNPQNCDQTTLPLYSPIDYLVRDGTFLGGAIPSFVYVMQSGEGGPVKIGCTDCPEARAMDLQCGNPQQITIPAVVAFFEPAFAVESRSHRGAQAYRIRGEWFDLSVLEAVEFILAAAHDLTVEGLPFAIASQRLREERREQMNAMRARDRAAVRRKLGLDD